MDWIKRYDGKAFYNKNEIEAISIVRDKDNSSYWVEADLHGYKEFFGEKVKRGFTIAEFQTAADAQKFLDELFEKLNS